MNSLISNLIRYQILWYLIKLDIKEFKNISNIDGLSDPLENAIKKYENHPGITAITEKFNFTVRF